MLYGHRKIFSDPDKRRDFFYVLNHVEISLGNNGVYMQFVYHHYLKRHVFKNNQQNTFYKYTSAHP